MSPDSFTRLWALGYTRLVPVIPPDAQVSENSTLYRRVGTRQDARGKLPGVRGRNGLWHSWDWTQHVTDPDDFDRWQAMGAGTGIVTGDGLIAIDADTTDEALARIIRDTIREHLGETPIRVGRYPKALYLLRVTDPYSYRRIDFGPPDEHRNYERVEVLSDRKFFVAEGTHPKTGKPYTWPRDLVPYADLPLFRPEQIDDLLTALRAALPSASTVQIEGGGDTPHSQEALRGDLAAIRKAVHATPNTSEFFPTRESYRDFGYAVKAALPDNAGEAFDIFADWCARWQDGDNDPGVVDADWRRMKPPFRRGAGWLYEIAERLSGGAFTAAEVHFQPVPERAPSPFDLQSAPEPSSKASDTFPLLTIAEIVQRPPPTFLIDRHVPETSVGFLYADPGVGKSFLALDMALSIAHGMPEWHGAKVAVPEDPAVLYIAAEGSFDLRNRIMAWQKHKGVAEPARTFLVLERTVRFTSQTDVDKLVRTIHAAHVRPALVVVDTVSRALPGVDENGQADMTVFVEACAAVQREFACSVLGVHHTNKSGGMRGSTVLYGAGDYVMKLERKRGSAIGTLLMEKQKAAEDGWTRQVIFERVALDDGQSSLVPVALDGPAGTAGSGKMGATLADLVLSAMQAAWDAGEPWHPKAQTRERYAVRRMAADFGVAGDKAESLLAAWEAGGLIEFADCGGRSKVKGYRVHRPADGGGTLMNGLGGIDDLGDGDVFG